MVDNACGSDPGWIQALMECANIGVFSVDLRSGRVLRCNEAFARILGFPSTEAAIGFRTGDLYVDPREREETLNRFLSDPRVREKGFVRFEARRKRADTGEEFDCLVFVRLVPNDAGEIERLDCTVEDIRERKRAEKAFRLGEERFRLVFEEGPVAMAIADLSGTLTRTNAVFCRFLGRSPDDLAMRPFSELLHPDEPADAWDRIISEGRELADRDWRFVRADGGVAWGHVRAYRMRDEDEAHSVVVMVQDVTERRLAEESLRRSEERYREVFEQATGGILLLDPDSVVVEANPAFLMASGYAREEVIGHRAADLWSPQRGSEPAGKDGDALAEWTQSGRVRLVRKDGTRMDMEARSRTLPDGRALMMVTDISDALRREQERQRAARIESIGVLAGGIAHDFNNLLTAVLGFVQLAHASASDPEEVRSSLDRAMAAIETAQKLTQQLLSFARGGAPIKKACQPAALVRDAVAFALRGSGVVCQYDLAEDLWPIIADVGQVTQVFHNLVLNAVQSMPGGGEIRVSLRNRNLSGMQDLPDGPYIEFRIRDRGGGIPSDVLPYIFDPYFTTRAGGTGLGLSTSYRVVEQHHGRIGVEVEPGVGSTFTVLLPASPDASVPEPPPITPSRPGRGRVLVMDDEASIRALLGTALSRFGYEVVAVGDGTRAIEEWMGARQVGRPFDIAVMDLTISGGMGGRETIRRLKALDPGARAIVSSGYSTDPVMSRFREEGFDGVVAKPYRIEVLISEIERILTGRGT